MTVEEYKNQGNTAFTAGNFTIAIDHYTSAITLAESSSSSSVHSHLHILYSNRAAAYLARNQPGDPLLALSDANASIRLNSTYAKSYTRKGQALLALQQPMEAYTAFQQGIQHDNTNTALREGMEQATIAIQKSRMSSTHGSTTTATTPSTTIHSTTITTNVVSSSSFSSSSATDTTRTTDSSTKAKGVEEEEDPMAAFFAEVTELTKEKDEKLKLQTTTHVPVLSSSSTLDTNNYDSVPTKTTLFQRIFGNNNSSSSSSSTDIIKNNVNNNSDDGNDTLSAGERAAVITYIPTGKEYEVKNEEEILRQSQAIQSADLGTAEEQTERITGNYAKWLNLNPFEVLLLPYTCTEDDIRLRYRKLSALIHPDKNSHPKANDAFNEVKQAYDRLLDPNQRRISAALMDNTIKELEKQRKKKQKLLLKNGLLPSSSSSTTTTTDSTTIESKLIVGKGLVFPDIETAIEIRKAFADVEHRRKTFETRVKEMAEREAQEALAEHEAQIEQAKADVEWATGRDNRKQQWEEFGDKQVQKKRKVEGTDVSTTPVGSSTVTASDTLRYGVTVNASATSTTSTSSTTVTPTTVPILPPEDYKRKWR